MWGRLWFPLLKGSPRMRMGKGYAGHDPLTGLSNRRGFLSILEETLRVPTYRCSCLVLINMDRFRVVNHACGSDSGDAVLLQLAGRLRRAWPHLLAVARISGDEFGLIAALPSLESKAKEIVVAVRDAMTRPLQLKDGTTVTMTCSLGAVDLRSFPSSVRAIEVMGRAEVALGKARQARGAGIAFGSEGMVSESKRRFELESELRLALAKEQLVLYLQSQVDSAGVVSGAECLVRWQHPQQGPILPGEFLPIAEESDLIVDIGTWVLRKACELQRTMMQRGFEGRLSVNVSPRQFMKADFVDHVLSIVAEARADARRLTLEVTEGLLMKDLEDVASKMHHLRNQGLRLSIDDFGTGFSSLSYLNHLPVDEVKIDRQFIREAPTKEGEAAVVKAIMSIANSMGMQVVAEGVETLQHAQFLSELGACTRQGFLYSRPEPALDWLQRVLKIQRDAGTWGASADLFSQNTLN